MSQSEPPTVRLAPLGAEHAEAVAGLYHRVWHATQASLQDPRIAAFRDLAFFRDRATVMPPQAIGAFAGPVLLGFLAWRQDVIWQLFVDAPARGHGVGARLLGASEAALASAGCREARLNCIAGNTAARRFYERHGWHHAATLVETAAWAEGSLPVTAWLIRKALAPD